ncbi:uncharacterized protein BYT42DRAFT_587536 [Radiomyces spectabilis]|uniref:uncharacterized protein n=1 Tax=Radiomyces spectabilis TaxID=64574 RepID=UPI00221FA0D7|nr:uncharacterized protein BYT42DRAFT_587536 [Radiomyces spectabilis]KAI8366690.1 hypothetical protein BYT42DRAFT_587536 [Radiomyces spectabilis]
MFTSLNHDKGSFVDRAKAERIEREKKRQEETKLKRQGSAVRVLQRWWRQRNYRPSDADMWREWDQMLDSETKMNEAELLRCLGLYCLFSRSYPSDKRLTRVAQLVLRYTSVSVPSFYVLLVNRDYMQRAERYLLDVVNQLLKRVVTWNDDGTMYLTGVELTVLLQLLNPTSYQLKQMPPANSVIDNPKQTLRATGCKVLESTLCSFSLREAMTVRVQQIVRLEERSKKYSQGNSLPSDTKTIQGMKLWLSTMVRIALFPIENVNQLFNIQSLDTSAHYICENILATPAITAITDRNMTNHLRTWTMNVIYPLLTDKKHNPWAEALDGNSCLFLLGNIVELAREKESKSKRFVEFVNACLRRLACSFSERQIPPFTHYHPLFKWSSATWGNSLEAAVYDRVVSQMEFLWSIDYIADILVDVLNFSPMESILAPSRTSKWRGALKKLSGTEEDGQTEKGYYYGLFSMEVQAIFSMYHQLSALFTVNRKTILYRLAFTKDLIPKLWRVMQCFGPRGNMAIYLDAARKSNTAIEKEPLIIILKIFCELCSIVFLTLDDVDLFQNQKPLSTDDVKNIGSFLNKFYFALIQHEPDEKKVIPASAAYFQSARRLLLQIYDLDTRHRFCPSDHWLLVSDPMNKPGFLSLFQTDQSNATDFLARVREGESIPLRILQLMPHTIPFTTRLKIFRDWITLDRATVMTKHVRSITVRRKYLLEDGLRGLSGLPPSAWKGTIRVTFVNEYGTEEAGIDQGGPFKDFITLIVQEVFKPDFGLFTSTTNNMLYPSPSSSIHGARHISIFEFIGKLMGKAVYEGILLDAQFAGFLLSKLLGRNVFLEELKELDIDVWRNLTFLKRYDGDVEDLGLTFAVDEEVVGEMVTHELKYYGKHLTVTNPNKLEYIFLMADYKLNQRTREQTAAFVNGFRSVISASWIKVFSPPELQRIISGEDTDFDVNDLRKHVEYQNGYFDQHPVIRLLWQIVDEFSSEDKRAFLRFVTSCSKPPLGGFDYLSPPFTIRMVATEADPSNTGNTRVKLVKSLFKGRDNKNGWLPTSSTCFNLLKLPAYTKKSLLREKLCYVIHSNAGFELS